MRWIRRLQLQIGLAVAGLLAVTTAVFSTVDVSYETARARANMENELTVVARNVATLSAPHLLVEDYAATDELVLRIAELPIVSRLTLTDPIGIAFSQAISNGASTHSTFARTSLVPPPKVEIRIAEHDGVMELWHPVFEHHLLGWVRIEASLEPLTALQAHALRHALTSGTALVVVSLVLLLLFLRRHIRAVERFKRFAGELPSARGLQMPRERSSLEVEELTDALNEASRRLQAQEQSLRDSESRYRTLFEESKDVIFIDTPDGRLIDINPAGVELFGYDDKQAMLELNIEASIYRSPGERQRFKDALARDSFVKDYELALRTRDGQPITALVTATVVRDDNGEPHLFRGILRDVTATRELEHQLRHAQRMEAVGRLTGGIAHDFNNILTAILGYASLLEVRLPPGTENAQATSQIIAAGRRAADLTQSLLTFSRKQILDTQVVDLNAVVCGLADLVRSTVGERIAFETALDAAPLAINADARQIEQVLLNLATNARDAMPQGGTLRMATRTIGLDSTFVAAHGYGQPGTYAQLIVSDTGIGMDAETKSHIFEPFFTTKEVGQGTGLGLATVYGIVKRHEGYINVYSEPGRGSVFRIYLPIASADVAEARDLDTELPGELPVGNETLLLVEDDDAVRAMLETTLSANGYRVLVAADGAEGEALFAAHREEVDLLLLDVVLPKKNGREIFAAARALCPNVPVLFVSGYTRDIIEHQKLLDADTSLLLKPVMPAALLRRVREILDASAPHAL